MACLAMAWALAACAGSGSQTSGQGLEKPTKIYVSALEPAADLPPIDPAAAARLKKELPGLTDDAAQIELVRRFSATVGETLVAALRAGGLDAMPGGGERMQASDIGLLINGKLRAADASAANPRQRKPGANRIAAEFTLTYFANTETSQTVLTFTTEGESAGQAAAAPARSGGPATSGGRLSPDVDAAARRTGRTAAERVLAFAAEKGWLKGPAVAATRR
jgi:hypothetical protein